MKGLGKGFRVGVWRRMGTLVHGVLFRYGSVG